MVEVTPNQMVDTAYLFVQSSATEKEGKLLSTKIKVIEKGEKHKGAFEAGKVTFADKHAILAKIISIFGVKLAKTDEVSVAKALLAFTRDNRDSLDVPHRQNIVKIIDTFQSPEQAETLSKIKKQIEEVKVAPKKGIVREERKKEGKTSIAIGVHRTEEKERPPPPPTPPKRLRTKGPKAKEEKPVEPQAEPQAGQQTEEKKPVEPQAGPQAEVRKTTRGNVVPPRSAPRVTPTSGPPAEAPPAVPTSAEDVPPPLPPREE